MPLFLKLDTLCMLPLHSDAGSIFNQFKDTQHLRSKVLVCISFRKCKNLYKVSRQSLEYTNSVGNKQRTPSECWDKDKLSPWQNVISCSVFKLIHQHKWKIRQSLETLICSLGWMMTAVCDQYNPVEEP